MLVHKPVPEGGVFGFDNVKPHHVADSLSTLHGPVSGLVVLPNRLNWSSVAVYDVTDPVRTKTLYAIVIREALTEEDLAEFIDKGTLLRVWSELDVPQWLREAWEKAHRELR